MSISPIPRAAISDAVFAQLVDEILSGRLAPDDPLPAERDLAESFEVNRHAVREALKRVQQSGLIRIAQGGKTRVLDWRENAGLDLLVELTRTGAVPPRRLLRDIAEMRCSVGTDAARLCALRATDEQLARVSAIAAQRRGADAPFAELLLADGVLWTAIIDGSGNLAYRLGLNTIIECIAAIGGHHLIGYPAELADREAHLELAARIADRDSVAARDLAQQLLGRVVDALND
ncbi:FadR/GntR family transcriptional regulator [Antrihabitans sp. YC2-6]|uniref:FadR/GntR family transcriptional regulator n=1 Tax=Antrihabitans sp. YC2-6 TaxID=2799498 RepID=UPI0018F3433F|nr:GntR family transcriptional regulator [Antrihabitans sp. YC2-6]MBJ8346768.1 FadR family transcriptional regulator [Antrihabitans sp. YC2-6]